MFAEVGRKILQIDFLELLMTFSGCIYHLPLVKFVLSSTEDVNPTENFDLNHFDRVLFFT